MVRTQIYLPENLLVKLKKEALKRKTTISSLIREGIENFLDSEKPQIKEGIRYDQNENPLLYISDLGKEYNASKGPSDLSRNIDKFVYKDE